MRTRGWMAAAVFLASVLTGLAWAQREGGSTRLSAEAKAVMRPQMRQHGPEMEQLIWSVVLLQRHQTAVLAERLSGSERLARPMAGQLDTVNAAVPEKFYVLQDLLHERATDLQVAAAKGDDDGVAAAFGRLTETCVACHARYLE